MAAARAASKLKQLHALLAMAICARNRVLSQQLIGLGVVEVLAAIIASKEAGARPRQHGLQVKTSLGAVREGADYYAPHLGRQLAYSYHADGVYPEECCAGSRRRQVDRYRLTDLRVWYGQVQVGQKCICVTESC